jgi:protein O-GlcNAc transferase
MSSSPTASYGDEQRARRNGGITRTVNAGFAHHQAGRLERAEALYRKALARDPEHAEALHLLGVIAYQRGDSETAVTLIEHALPQLQELPEAHLDLGNALREAGRLAEAADCYRRAVVLDPDYGMGHCNLGRALSDQGSFEAGLESARRAVELIPDFLGAHINCAAALSGLRRFEEAEAALHRALELIPDRAETHHALGDVLCALRRFDEGSASFRRALALKPDFAQVHTNLGIALSIQNRLDEAVESLQQALALAPDDAQARMYLGATLADLRKFDDAVASYQGTLAREPDNARVHCYLGNVLRIQNKLNEAIACFERAVTLAPDDADALTAWFRAKQIICDWSDYYGNEAKVRKAIAVQPSLITALALSTLSSTAAEQLNCAREIAASITVPKAMLLPRRQPRSGKRIRLGYLSEDLRQHPVGVLIVEQIERHDRRDFEVIGYSFGPENRTPMRARFTGAFDRFVDIDKMPHRQAAELIHSDAIDILIDLTGYTGYCRPEILACRPASIQVSHLGFPGTMGADFIDYIIVDPFLVPMDQQPFYSEKLVYLPDCYQPSDTRRKIADPPPTRAACGLPEQGFVFCSFNNAYKITPIVFDIWMRLLKAVPGGVLWLYTTNDLVKQNLRREASVRGVAPERVVFAQPAPMPEYLARLGLADLFLDTLPYNAGATANDALWAGLPLLTCAGGTYVGRMAGAVLTAARLPELITTSLEAYEGLALRLATEPGLLAGLRQKLARNRSTVPLFDTARFTRNLETAYRRMWEIWRARQPPAPISVPSPDAVRSVCASPTV